MASSRPLPLPRMNSGAIAVARPGWPARGSYPDCHKTRTVIRLPAAGDREFSIRTGDQDVTQAARATDRPAHPSGGGPPGLAVGAYGGRVCRRTAVHPPGPDPRSGVVERKSQEGRRSSGLSARDRPGPSSDRRCQSRLVAGGRASGGDRGGNLARRAALPRGARALRRRLGLAGLRARVHRAADRPRVRRRALREHVPAVLDLGPLDGLALPPRGPFRLAATHDRPGGAGVSDPARGIAAAAGPDRDRRPPAARARPCSQPPTVVGRAGRARDRAGVPDRSVRRVQGGDRNQAEHRPASRHSAQLAAAGGRATTAPRPRADSGRDLRVRRQGRVRGGARLGLGPAPADGRGRFAPPVPAGGCGCVRPDPGSWAGVAVPGDRRLCLGAGLAAVARDRRILQPAACPRLVAHPDPRRRLRHRANDRRGGRGPGPPRPAPGPPGGWTDCLGPRPRRPRLPPAPAHVDAGQRGTRGLPDGGPLAPGPRRARCQGGRRERLGDLLRRPRGLHVREPDLRPGRPKRALGRRA